MHVIFSKIELEISPFLTVIQFYSNIVEKRVGKGPQEISMRPTFRNILTNLKGTRYPRSSIDAFGRWATTNGWFNEFDSTATVDDLTTSLHYNLYVQLTVHFPLK